MQKQTCDMDKVIRLRPIFLSATSINHYTLYVDTFPISLVSWPIRKASLFDGGTRYTTYMSFIFI